MRLFGFMRSWARPIGISWRMTGFWATYTTFRVLLYVFFLLMLPVYLLGSMASISLAKSTNGRHRCLRAGPIWY